MNNLDSLPAWFKANRQAMALPAFACTMLAYFIGFKAVFIFLLSIGIFKLAGAMRGMFDTAGLLHGALSNAWKAVPAANGSLTGRILYAAAFVLATNFLVTWAFAEAVFISGGVSIAIATWAVAEDLHDELFLRGVLTTVAGLVGMVASGLIAEAFLALTSLHVAGGAYWTGAILPISSWVLTIPVSIALVCACALPLFPNLLKAVTNYFGYEVTENNGTFAVAPAETVRSEPTIGQ